MHLLLHADSILLDRTYGWEKQCEVLVGAAMKYMYIYIYM